MPAAPGFEKVSLIKGDESESLGFDLADHGRVVDNGLRRRNKDDRVREATASLWFRRSISIVLPQSLRHSMPASWNFRTCCRPMPLSGVTKTERDRSCMRKSVAATPTITVCS